MESFVDNVESVKPEAVQNRRRRKKSVGWRRRRRINGFAKMLFTQGYHPLHLVEVGHPSFFNFIKLFQPWVNLTGVSSIRIQKECESIYLKEKTNLLNILSEEVPSRIGLSLDFSPSSDTFAFGYVFIRANFIDNKWNSHCLILDVVKILPGKDDHLHESIKACLSEWQLDGRVLSITIDQSLSNYTILENLGAAAANNNNGQLLSVNCLAQILSELAQDALSSTSEVVGKIRNGAKFCKDLPTDIPTRWDTTYRMLAAACEQKQLFSSSLDPNITITTLSTDDWKQANTVCTYLKYFLDVAAILSTSSSYLTASVLFLEASKIQIELTRASLSQDPFVHDLTKPLKHKFDKYWRDSRLGLAIAAVMDPRFKLNHVKLTFYKVCGEEAEDWTKIVDYTLHQLFRQYTMKTLVEPEPEVLGEDGVLDFHVHTSNNHQTISELDLYLEGSLWPRLQEFGVLSWWRSRRDVYPTLSKMARDILSMPMSTAARDSIFDTETKRIDSQLPSATLQALVCIRDWFKCGSLLSPST